MYKLHATRSLVIRQTNFWCVPAHDQRNPTEISNLNCNRNNESVQNAATQTAAAPATPISHTLFSIN